jgi:glycine dehydrogenase subunit 1
MICELTGMDITNASMYDGPTSAAEAMFVATSSLRRKKILVSNTVANRIKDVVYTYAKFRDIEVEEVSDDNGLTSIDDLKSKLNKDIAGILVQNPNKYGVIEEYSEVANLVHEVGGYLIDYVDPHTLSLVKTPASMGADIVVGDGQSLGIPLSFGGPYVGFMAVGQKLMRKLPGRIVGMSNDLEGKRAFVLTLQAREQHIRREKANSNICSNQSLMALYVTIYLSLLGKKGFKEVGTRSYKAAHYLLKKLEETNKFKLKYDLPFFNEFVVTTKVDVDLLNKELLNHNILGGSKISSNEWLLCANEKMTKKDIDDFVKIVGGL